MPTATDDLIVLSGKKETVFFDRICQLPDLPPEEFTEAKGEISSVETITIVIVLRGTKFTFVFHQRERDADGFYQYHFEATAENLPGFAEAVKIDMCLNPVKSVGSWYVPRFEKLKKSLERLIEAVYVAQKEQEGKEINEAFNTLYGQKKWEEMSSEQEEEK